MNLYFFIFILRLLVPLLVFNYPFFVILIILTLDGFDAEFAAKVVSYPHYQLFDKLLDFWWYLILLFFSSFFLKEFFLLLFALFVYRLIGEIIFVLKRENKIFLFFPNFFENVFLLIFMGISFARLEFIIRGSNFFYFFLLACLVKLIQEYLVHVKKFVFMKSALGLKRKWRRG